MRMSEQCIEVIALNEVLPLLDLDRHLPKIEAALFLGIGVRILEGMLPINAPDATGLNFLFDFSPGVRINVARHEALNVGYKFLHISNASTTNFNPGVDNNV